MLPMKGFRVLELAEFYFGPSAAAVWADWGAEVIKIEDPSGGDRCRGAVGFGLIPIHNVNYIWEQANRNKKSVALNLNSPKGREIVYKLAENTDIFLTSFRPSTCERLGLEYEAIRKINPRIIYVRLSGYGLKGSERNKGGYDYGAFWARGGFSSAMGEPGTPPVTLLPGMGDGISGMFAAGAGAVALLAREKTGQGTLIDISLLGSGVWANASYILGAYHTGIKVTQVSRKEMRNPLWNTYQARDGKWLQLIMLESDRYWPGFCRATGLQELEHNPKFNSHITRGVNNKELIARLDEVFSVREVSHWAKLLDENGCLWSPIVGVLDVSADPQVLENSYLVDFNHPQHGHMKVVANPAQFNNIPVRIQSAAPELGQHTEEVLLGLGYCWAEIGRLKEAQVTI